MGNPKVTVLNPENIELKVSNRKPIAFSLNNSKYWFTFQEASTGYDVNKQARKLAIAYKAQSILYTYLDEIDNSNVITVCNERGNITYDIYSFRRINRNFKNPLVYEYLSPHDLFFEVGSGDYN